MSAPGSKDGATADRASGTESGSARLAPLSREAVPEFEEEFAKFERRTGFLPNGMLVMARRPALVRARAVMAQANWDRTIPTELADLVFLMASLATGCRYCEAHRTTALAHRGTSEKKLQAMWEFETSPLFTESERAALRLARDSASVPNSVTDEHFRELRRFFSEDEIVDIVASSCAAAFSNRWNDTMATPLEPIPIAETSRIHPGWDPGKHRW